MGWIYAAPFLCIPLSMSMIALLDRVCICCIFLCIPISLGMIALLHRADICRIFFLYSPLHEYDCLVVWGGYTLHLFYIFPSS